MMEDQNQNVEHLPVNKDISHEKTDSEGLINN